MQKDIKVKLLNRSSLANEESVYRIQSIKNEAKWGSCSFTFNPLEKDYDWLVIIDDIPKITPNRVEQLLCPKENTILVTTEPTSITRYGRAFAKQLQLSEYVECTGAKLEDGMLKVDLEYNPPEDKKPKIITVK